MAISTHKRRKKVATSRILLIIFFCSLSFFFFTVLYGAYLPFVGYNAWNFTTYSLIAHNYLQFGFFETLFAPIVSVSQTLPSEPSYYLHHPQLLSLLMSLSFLVLGESFLTARLVVICGVIASLYLLYCIGGFLSGKRYSLLVVIVATLIPGFSLFGKMIGQESLVLFFTLLLTFLYLRYEKKQYVALLGLMVVTSIVGVFSDWPMVYFSILLGCFALAKGLQRVGLILIVTPILSALAFLLYIYSILGSLTDLLAALQNRSLGTLLQYDFWPILWVSAISVRSIFYFTPLIVFCSLLFIFLYYKGKFRDVHGIIFVWGIFGVLHIIFYPEGSFGHPYWIYYLVPFITFSSAYVLETYVYKHTLMVAILFVFLVTYSAGVHLWKIKETSSQLFRYELAAKISQKVTPYEKIIIDDTSVIDPDLFAYPFFYKIKIIPVEDVERSDYSNSYVHTCNARCHSAPLSSLLAKYSHTRLQTPQAEAIIINLDKKNRQKVSRVTIPSTITSNRSVQTRSQPKSPFKYFYTFLLEVIHMPQL